MDRLNVTGGLAGKILRVDLSSGTIRSEPSAPYAERFIGGRTINSYILLMETKKETRWSDPANPLIFGVGRLVGTAAPGANRISIDTINPYNNGKGSANFGGYFGNELKYAGYDTLVITGIAQKPVYLHIEDDKAELRDAAFLWGKTTDEVDRLLKETFRDDQTEVACIGPAGENLVLGSGIVSDCGKVAGGSGVGCVMGSKRLKAIAVRGHGGIEVADPARFMKAVDRAIEKVKKSAYLPKWRKGGVEGRYFPESPVWDFYALPRNGQDEYWPMRKRQNLVGTLTGVPRFKKKMFSCFGCPAACMPYLEINDGVYEGTRGLGYWINSVWYSTRFDVDDPAASLKFHLLANQLGVDGDAAATVLSWAFECWENGLITERDTGGLKLEWGNAEAMVAMLEKLAYRRDIGDLLAEGVMRASQRLGKGSEAYAIHVKGQDSVDPYRAGRGFGFGVAISPIGGRHLRGAVSNPEVTGPRNLEWSPDSYNNIPEAVFWQTQTKELEDMLGFCVYVGTWSGIHALEVEDYAALLSAATGSTITEQAMMSLGLRGVNLEKAFNTFHADYRKVDDFPPRRYMKEPIASGPKAGMQCDEAEWGVMLERFYALNGWDPQTGQQTRDTLLRNGLQDIADRFC
jgi:aldehyde:ferredoxin oxidoreductase